MEFKFVFLVLKCLSIFYVLNYFVVYGEREMGGLFKKINFLRMF